MAPKKNPNNNTTNRSSPQTIKDSGRSSPTDWNSMLINLSDGRAPHSINKYYSSGSSSSYSSESSSSYSSGSSSLSYSSGSSSSYSSGSSSYSNPYC
jgi:hypothetical protein